MPWYKRLRWRLIGSQFLVAFVGVIFMILATQLIIIDPAPRFIEAQLTDLLSTSQSIAQTEQLLLAAFRNAVFLSVIIAAIAAVAAGVVTSFILWRTIIRPLRSVAERSQRIVDGRYGERVALPTNSGEAMIKLVTNFNQMTDYLDDVEQQRVALLGNISHELRTPLTSLNGYIEGLMDGLFPPTEQTFAWMLAETKRLSRLVEDIHSLSRIEAGQFGLTLENFGINGLIKRVVAQLHSQALGKEIDMMVVEDNTAVYIHADPDKTTQILINLIGNAIRYTPEGGSIQINIKRQQKHAFIAVQDNGIGIPADALPYLFERFYRVEQSRARTTGGSGIGLTISRHLAWSMGGDIIATSSGSHQGSTFTLSLPLANG